MYEYIIAIPLKPNIQIEYARELCIKLNDHLKEPYIAKLECLPKSEQDPIGICIFKNAH